MGSLGPRQGAPNDSVVLENGDGRTRAGKWLRKNLGFYLKKTSNVQNLGLLVFF